MVLYILFSNPISYPLHLLKLSGIGYWDQQNPSFLKISEFFLLLALKEIWVSSEDSDSSAALSSGGCFFPTPCSGIGILFVLFYFFIFLFVLIAASRPFCFPPSQKCPALILMLTRLCYPHCHHMATITLQPCSHITSVSLQMMLPKH